MSIESIKARLRRHDRQRMRYGYSDETAPQIWERELRALLKVAEAAVDVIDGCPYKGVLDFPELRAALDDWRNNDSI